MRKNLLIATGILMFFACSKEKPQPPVNPPVSEMVGTWSIYSFKAKYPSGDSVYATVADHPCLANNKIEYKSDNTLATHYAGTDTCWLTPPPATPVIIRTGTVVGQKGDAPNTTTWSQSGTTILVGANHVHGIISKSGGKTYFTQVDTIDNASTHEVLTIVEVKD